MRDSSTLAKNLISISPEELKVDWNVKKILSYKPLLARILNEVMSECKNMSYESIEACIEGDVKISAVPVDPGVTNATDQIVGQAQEEYANMEGMNVYDIRTYIRLPGQDSKVIKILIDIEAQNEYSVHKDISCYEVVTTEKSVYLWDN